jgi:hypothetical protein
MRLFVLCVSVAAALSGCALRPRYGDFVTSKTAGKEVTFVVTDAATSKPVPNAKIELSELRNRIQVTAGPDGTFKVPVEKKYLDENPVFVVTLPKGFEQYRLSLAAPPAAPVEAPAPAPVAPPAPAPAPAIEAAPDAGTPASNG